MKRAKRDILTYILTFILTYLLTDQPSHRISISWLKNYPVTSYTGFYGGQKLREEKKALNLNFFLQSWSAVSHKKEIWSDSIFYLYLNFTMVNVSTSLRTIQGIPLKSTLVGRIYLLISFLILVLQLCVLISELIIWILCREIN